MISGNLRSSSLLGANRGNAARDWLIALATLAIVVAGIYHFVIKGKVESPEPPAVISEPQTTQPEVDLEPSEPAPPPPEPAAPVEPPRKLPALKDSDKEARADIASLASDGALAKWLVSDEVIRKWVAAVNTAAQGELMHKNRPFTNLQDTITVDEIETDSSGAKTYQLSSQNYQRYDQAVRIFALVDTASAAKLYQFWYPRLSEAYGELGIKNKNFHQVVIEAIDNVLAAPQAKQPILLVRPSVYYKFADEKMEKMPGLHKLMIRIGPDNAARVKEKLRELKTELQKIPTQ